MQDRLCLTCLTSASRLQVIEVPTPPPPKKKFIELFFHLVVIKIINDIQVVKAMYNFSVR